MTIGKMKRIQEVSYDLFLVPVNNRKIRKVRLSQKNLRFLAASCAISLFFFIFNMIGFWYYRSLYTSLESKHRVMLSYEREKVEFVNKITVLEKTVNETEKLAGNLAALVGTEKIPLQKGVGPIPSSDFDIKKRTEAVELSLLDPKMERLEDTTLNLQGKIKELIKIQEDKLSYLASTPSIWPVKGWVTSDFGYRRSPFTFARDFHSGIDIAAQWGTPILAAADGVVTYASYKGGLGKAVIIDHGFGIKSVYGHTSRLLVREGQKVAKGTRLALVGSTGHSTGPHLHYEIHVDGVPVDPMKYILN